jgi:hypothetical protein
VAPSTQVAVSTGHVTVDTGVVGVSSVAGRVLVDQNSTEWQTQAAVRDNLGNLVESSTRAVGTNSTMRGLSVRLLLPDSSYTSGQASSAGDNIAVSSAAGVATYIYAYNFSPISTAAQLIRLLNGSTAEMWRTRAIAPSTMGDQTYACQCAVSPPAYLFRTAAANPVILNITSSGVNYALSYWRE